MIRKISVILVFGLLILSATGGLITSGKESSKLHIEHNDITEIIRTLSNNRSELAYYPESHDFGDIYKGKLYNTTFEIWNSECCALYYELTENCSWLDVHPTSGVSYEGDPPDTIYVDINTTGLVWGPYICNISITSNSGNGVFAVTLNIINEGFTNITVGDAWEFLSNTTNGIQIPIDVRTDEEWKKEHIDTQHPENPKHHSLSDLQNETKLQNFKALYYGKEVILYCKSGVRSEMAAQILVDNKFYGTIYNMPGGITAWKAAGYPTKSNQPPDKPTITGPATGNAGTEYGYTFNATDPEEDYLYFCINWSDNTDEVWIGPIAHDAKVTVNHTWDEKGTYNIRAKAIDQFYAEGIWANLLVTMPKNKLLINSFLLRYLEQHQYLCTILRCLQSLR